MKKSTTLGLALLMVTLLAGCSDDAGTTAPSSPSDDKPEGQAASGAPVLVGFINQEASPVVSFPELGHGNEAAVSYLNTELGGVAGRPIKVEKCITNGSPESSSACASQMVEKEVVVVRGGIDLGSAAALPILEAAGIPYIGMVPLLPSDFTSKAAFAFESGSPGNVASALYIAKTLKAKKVSVIHSDNPPGAQFANVFIKDTLLQNGLRKEDVVLVAENEGTPDLTAALAKANEQNPDAIVVGFVPPTCVRVMQAVAALSIKAAMFYTPPCGDPAVLRAGGTGAQGAFFVSSLLHIEANADDPDVRIYVEKSKRYGNKKMTVDSLNAATGFSAMMNLHEVMERVGPERLSGQAVTEALRSAGEEPNFMAHPYICDGKRLAGLPSVCAGHVRLYRFTGGKVVDVQGEWLSAAT